MALGRPPRGRLRHFTAYVTTARIIASYLWLNLQARFRSAETVEALTRKTHLRNARRVHHTIARLQGLFIKIGQLISIMTNFLPSEFRAELEGLQDQVPPRPLAEVERRFKEELGRSPHQLYATFADVPIASASIGQVHRARLFTGEEVAVKVQYPDIEEIVQSDLRALRRILGVVVWFIPYRGLTSLFEEIRAMVLQELDFTIEANNLERIAANFASRPEAVFPKVHRELSSARILTTGWMDGIKVSDHARLDAGGIDRSALARTVVQAYCQQIFTDGVYHADPHPGNLLVRKGEGPLEVVFLDFGAVAEVSPKMRRGLADIIHAGITRDTPGVSRAMRDMGFIARGADPEIFDKVIDFFHQKFQEEIQLESFSLRDVKFDPQRSFENLADLRRLEVSIRDLADQFHVPKEWILLERTVLLLMGLCTDLDPTLNPVQVIRPYLEEFVFGRDGDWSSFVLDSTKEAATTLFTLPGEMKRFLQRAQRGELEVRFRGLDAHARLVYTVGRQLIYTLFTIAAAVFALVFDGRGEARFARYAAFTALGFALVLALSLVVTRAKLRRKRA